MKNALALSFVCALGLAACGAPADEPAQEETPPPAPPVFTVTILEPAEGSEVTGPVVTVRLAASVPILAAGDLTPNTGHHHLYLDAEQTPAMVPVPTVPGSIVHMGNAASEFRFDSVQPGTHRLIAVVADGVHVPLQPWVVDTITFTVR